MSLSRSGPSVATMPFAMQSASPGVRGTSAPASSASLMASANADAGTVVVDVLVVVVVAGGESSRAATQAAAPTSPETAERAATAAAALPASARAQMVAVS